MKVKNAMTKKVLVTKPDVSVREAAKTMTKYRVGSLVVVEKNKLIGIVTELDMMQKVVAGDLDPNITQVKDIMTKKVKTISADKTLEEAAEIMVNSEIKKLPVVENKKLVGILTATDLISVQPKLIEALAKLMLFEEHESVAG